MDLGQTVDSDIRFLRKQRIFDGNMQICVETFTFLSVFTTQRSLGAAKWGGIFIGDSDWASITIESISSN